MKKIIIFSTDVYCDLEDLEKKRFRDLLNELINEGHRIIFTSRDIRKKEQLTDINIDNKKIYFKDRDSVKNTIKINEGKSQYFIVVGNREQDLFMAATNKLFFAVPRWCKSYDDKVLKYGIGVVKVESLKKLINVIDNQNSWYYRLDLDKQTTVLSLTSANTLGNHSTEELEMVNGFRKYLKDGEKPMAIILLCHFLASISNNPEFREIKDWAIMPSSGTELNKDMLLFKEKARELMNGKKKEPIFIRHTATFKSHDPKNAAYRLPCDRHFDTIVLNDKYKGKLKGRTVCVFDDYLTNGTTFETARNLLKKEGVKKVFFVSLGKFGKKYIKQDYMLNGNLYNKGYSYEFIDRNDEYGKIDSSAIVEIENLHNIFFE
ncbi:phosphoribosyltransferase [Clostridium beijerinckii]|uniref:phosphoribosyltransferase n=1 Tax=Clostridium beijerinckii TaxID=1520 RepID=UPI0022266700|nr:phosphoribosyltransferase [Clostridium beijerinckii]UYZ36813.1 phosphoribosyltransferase [Clostridium beijerinckii]